LLLHSARSVPCLTYLREEIPAYSVLKDNEKYFRDRLPRLKKEIKSEIHHIIHSVKRPDGEPQTQGQTQEDLLSQLNSMSLDVLSAYVNSEARGLEIAESELKLRRSKGLHKAAAKSQEFAMEFSRFLTAYSGIVNIVQAVDAQYGGVACATLSLLFAVSTLGQH